MFHWLLMLATSIVSLALQDQNFLSGILSIIVFLFEGLKQTISYYQSKYLSPPADNEISMV